MGILEFPWQINISVIPTLAGDSGIPEQIQNNLGFWNCPGQFRNSHDSGIASYIYIYIYIYGQESDQAGIQGKKNVGGWKSMTKPPQKFFVYKFGKLTSSTFQKALDDFCATFGFHFIDERVPKKKAIFSILGGQVPMNIFFKVI